MLDEIIRDLHDSEINGGISWFYDNAWHVELGDALNGIAIGADVIGLDAAIEWLRAKAVRLYPDSHFAQKHRRGFE